MEPLLILLICLGILLIATYTDLKWLEVPDWLSYAGIFLGISIHIYYSIEQMAWWPILSGIIGLAITFAFACFMYYTGQWGGGDAKLLMALGAIVGFEPSKFAFGTSFMINLVFCGAAWGLAYSGYKAARNKTEFLAQFKKLRTTKPYSTIRLLITPIAVICVILSFVFSFLQIELLMLAFFLFFLSYVAIFVKSVELSSMHVWVSPTKLTEGDWLVKPIKVGNFKLTPPKLGLEKEDLAKIMKLYKQKKLDKVLVKYGIPFVPAFLISFILTWSIGNIVLFFIA
jgi:Flp pilus assembly protein protease CpaA